MRLFDKLASAGPDNIREAIAGGASNTVVFQVDEIARHYRQSDQLFWSTDDFPYANPPWDMCFVEWTEPDWSKGYDGTVERIDGKHENGLFVKRLPKGSVAKTANWLRQSTGALNSFEFDLSQASEVVLLDAVCSRYGSPKQLQVASFWFLRADGYVVAATHVGPGLGSFPNQEAAQRFFGSMLHIAGLAFTFANCSNVKIEDVTQESEPPAKIRRRLKIPEVKRYTLNICGHSTKPHRTSSGDPQTGIIPFHLCRGHFATYTADKPMFGNPKLVGRYWHPPHTRGKKDRGEVIKDYAIAEAKP